MRAGDVPLQPSEDGWKELPGGGEEDPQEEMVCLISPPTPEESGLTQKDIKEDSRYEMIEMISPLTLEESGKPGKGMEEEELEGEDLSETEQAMARPLGTEPDVKEEGPVELDRPDPVNIPWRSPDPEGAMLGQSPLEWYRPPLGPGRLIPAGMEDSYVTTLTQRGRGWLQQRRPQPAYADSMLAQLSPPSTPPSYAGRGVIPVAALVIER